LVFTNKYHSSQNKLSETYPENTESPEERGDVGVITKNGSTSTYKSDKYKFSFSYPTLWRIGDNRIGHGTFQLFNYDPSKIVGGSVFKKGMNKIEAVIITDPSGFFSEDTGNLVEVTIAGQKAYKLEYDGGISYTIALPSHPGKYLGISIYGDPSNYSILENLVEDITWL
jgi:hypothetical protein